MIEENYESFDFGNKLKICGTVKLEIIIFIKHKTNQENKHIYLFIESLLKKVSVYLPLSHDQLDMFKHMYIFELLTAKIYFLYYYQI